MTEEELLQIARDLTHGETDPNAVSLAKCRAIVDTLSSEQVRSLAAGRLHYWADTLIRANVAKVERRSQHTGQPPVDTPKKPKQTKLHAAYCECADCAESTQRLRDIDRKHFGRMRQIVDDYKNDIRMEWTRELLDTSFALGDGTTVTWGDATPQQHQARIDMLAKIADGTLQTAARHQAAIEAIGERRNLNEVKPGESMVA